jgi:hypothetical protein
MNTPIKLEGSDTAFDKELCRGPVSVWRAGQPPHIDLE